MFLLLCWLCVSLQISLCLKIEVNSAQVQEWDNAKNNSEIRCYCNLPECITTSYMCKSEGLGCFSDILAFSDVNKASHGCLDLLQSGRQDQCQNEPSSRSVAQPRSLLLCCYRDLCNHVDSPETRQRYNDTVLASSLVTDLDRSVMMVNSRLRQSPGYTNAEVWFRAATIAVPICGALILFVLIALAVRILQSDAMDDRVLAAKLRAKHSGFSPVSLNGPSFVHQLHDHERNKINGNLTSKKMPLLFHHESVNTTMSSVPFTGCVNRPTNHGQGVNVLHSCQQRHKNEANAKINLSQNGAEPSIPVVPVHSATQTPPETPSNLIDLHKSTSPCNNNCNIYQNEESPDELHPACALLTSAPSNHKLTYKKPLVTSWTESDVRFPHLQ
uniref:BMP and activin membrane-bound inhibitor homolog n=1 Tax=Cuerna arida TaxID=1464854 RepID=A0A1B6FSL3_9HEMI